MSEHVATEHDAQEGVGAAMRVWMRQTICGLHGHDTFLHFERDRMSLRCVSCGHETPGWDLNDTSRPTVTVRADAPHHAVVRPHLVSARRIA